jgi:preprotein translocase subunit SecA
VNKEEFTSLNSSDIVERLYQHAESHYHHKNDFIATTTFPKIKEVFETESDRYQNMEIILSDGIKNLGVVVSLKRATESKGKEVILAMEKSTTLSMIDDAWKEHLREMDELKQSVQNATYEQKDPLLIYKFESFGLFKKMVTDVNKEIVSFLMRANLPYENPNNMRQAREVAPPRQEQIQTSRSEISDTQPKPKSQPVKAEQKIGRNDPCPCGSVKKYKNCHGK